MLNNVLKSVAELMPLSHVGIGERFWQFRAGIKSIPSAAAHAACHAGALIHLGTAAPVKAGQLRHGNAQVPASVILNKPATVGVQGVQNT